MTLPSAASISAGGEENKLFLRVVWAYQEKMMATPEQKEYDKVLSEIKDSISRAKDINPWAAIELCHELQRHLNRVKADIAEKTRS